MPETIWILIPFAAGLALGAIHFAGLWCTLRRLPDLRRPIPALLGSFLVRLLLAIAGLYLVMNGQPAQLVAALAGFILMRGIMVRRLRRNPSSS
jgi:F1F0 ATPase subunit 2